MFWNLDINMQKRMKNRQTKKKKQCSLLLIHLLKFLLWMTSMGEGLWVSAWWCGTSFCNQLKHYEHIQHIFSTLSGKHRTMKAFLFVLKLCVFQHINKKMKEESTLSKKNMREFWSLSSNFVDDTQSTMAKDLTWVLVIIPALSLAYLCNLGLNKALWNTICTNRHLKSYFHPYG